MSVGRAFRWFTSNKSCHPDEERQGHVGVGDTWVDESRRADEWMGMNMGNKGGQGEKRELEERREEIKERNRGRNVDVKFCLVPQWEACTAAML